MVRTLPDIESLLVGVLKGDSEVQAIVGQRVATELPPKASFPFLALLLTGGNVFVEQHLTGTTVQVDAWGTSRAEARNLALVAQGVIHQIKGTYTEAVVSGVEDVIPVRRLYDGVAHRPRYMFEVRVYAHPVPA